MKTYDSKFQLLPDHIFALHKSEKKCRAYLKHSSIQAKLTLRKGLFARLKKTKSICIRLEGLLNVLRRNPCKNCQNETSWKVFKNQFSSTLKRVVLRHASFGYKTAIMVAIALGPNEMQILLTCSLNNGNILQIK